MNNDLAIVLGLLAAAILMFAVNRPRMDAVALLMLTLMPFTGVVSVGEALAGFSDPNVVLIATLFVIGEGLVRTGVAQRIGDRLKTKAGSSEFRLLALLMLSVGALGAVMSSTGVVAIFIPVTLRIAQATGTPPSRLMMPLSVAALTSGMLTLVATAPNLVVNAELVRHGIDGFGFLSVTPIGVPILVLSIGYMWLMRRWLPVSRDSDSAGRVPAGPARLHRQVRPCRTGAPAARQPDLARGGPRARDARPAQLVRGQRARRGTRTRPAHHRACSVRGNRGTSRGHPVSGPGLARSGRQ